MNIWMLYPTASAFSTLTAGINCLVFVTFHGIDQTELINNLLTMKHADNWDEYTTIDCPHRMID